MSKRNHKAIFERKIPPLDNFGAAGVDWELVCVEWVGLEPLTGRELLIAQQVQSQADYKAKLTHSPTTAAITSACRMKVARNNVVNENQPNADENFRIFHLESVVNVREQNRELELMLIERV